MPHFSECCRGADTYICQCCKQIKCSSCQPSQWRPDITGSNSVANVCLDCVPVNNTMKKVTKRMVEKYIKTRLKEPNQAVRALMKIYSYQTAEEMKSENTKVTNNIGFSSYDAGMLSQFAKQFQRKKCLSQKQMTIVTKIMPKYWRQIAEASNKAILDAQILKQNEIDNQQLSLELYCDEEK